MSIALVAPTNQSSGGGSGTGLVTATASILVGSMKCVDIQPLKLIVHCAATGAFKLDYMFTPDNGTSWFVGKTVSSSTVVVDGGVALYVQSAELIVEVGYQFKVQIYQSTGGDIDFAYEVRTVGR